ncbi:MAG: ArsR family transcriptional regulator [Chloroflexi bacterium]|nr:ArsR family transcriptional regulator [Chloroflexota bacterium]
MLYPYIIATNSQKVLSLLVKFSDQDFYEREISRRLGISSGSANRALNELFSSGVITRRQEGKMFFYSIDRPDAAIIALKKVINILLIEPLSGKLEKLSNRIVLYGSCALGTDTSESDLDLFVVSNRKKEVSNIISDFKFPMGYEKIHIQSVIKTPVELLKDGESENAFIEEVERGVTLWEKVANEPRA